MPQQHIPKPSYLGHPLASLTALRDHLEQTSKAYGSRLDSHQIRTYYNGEALCIEVHTPIASAAHCWATYLSNIVPHGDVTVTAVDSAVGRFFRIFVEDNS